MSNTLFQGIFDTDMTSVISILKQCQEMLIACINR